jgi:hypothetical protein
MVLRTKEVAMVEKLCLPRLREKSGEGRMMTAWRWRGEDWQRLNICDIWEMY